MYYNPQDYGLEVLGEIERSDGCYQFDMLVVWRESRGQYWIGEDSGCSCPSPFENLTELNELDGPYNKKGLKSRLTWIMDNDQYSYLSKAEYAREISEILSRIT